jgi:hypothetical protein
MELYNKQMVVLARQIQSKIELLNLDLSPPLVCTSNAPAPSPCILQPLLPLAHCPGLTGDITHLFIHTLLSGTLADSSQTHPWPSLPCLMAVCYATTTPMTLIMAALDPVIHAVN